MTQPIWTPLSRRVAGALLATVLALSLVACNSQERDGENGEGAEVTELILASTTSTQDSGLFDELIPAFEEANPEYKLKVVAVGTGEALELGKNKDADVLLVHARSDEEAFVAEGYGVERKDVMYNDFVIVGPEADPSGVGASADAAAAMKAISGGAAPFFSRGDDSGTNKKELKLWEVASVDPAGAVWYEQTGQGMGDTLKVASEKQGYTMTDRATFLNMRDALDVVVVFEGDPELFNQYGVIPVTDAVNQNGAQAFADWIVSDEGQKVIAEYGVETFGEPLFTPNAE